MGDVIEIRTPSMTVEQLQAALAAEREARIRAEGERDGFAQAMAILAERVQACGVESPEPVLIPSVRIRLKTPEERAAAEAEHARVLEQNRVRAQQERAYRDEMRAAKRAAARVYFIQHEGGERLIKIGTTTRDVSVRLRELQAGHSSPLVIRAFAPGGHREERTLHHRFSSLWVAGEWFRPGPDLLAYVALVADRGTL
jgi:hypothetical protein